MNQKIPRRSLLGGLGLAAAGLLALKTLPTQHVEVTAATPAEPAGTGYRLTEHIKKYYRSTTL
ncbi:MULTISPECIES: hypothetical protein [unclassified Undibacterium]|uniref:hypothetical protein n=1 Tax=unclassified Undibacterium TaxID=2630295 RepID=UPI002AC90435|nr:MULTISPECIES: hypothetical protein [unclassified Undibacterium]MEB0141030.1 hypothetical protein [Undibacterium sp. CCC2.1]MEB0174014.1 hypothetical protein [Undibacterium sp. CCC1.1]MEB0177970.1 hypothetical protein [Undibacterium sp. CCC3.4]MEB0217206.1 hypothetical protein [Undibacterium sp. 5I2]WPX42182.1 hypothetical protein RHM61_12300 [Undibacterium sp. CCC3.4]